MNTASEINLKNKAYVLVLNYNNWRDTIQCLESLYQTTYPVFQVICIDNASTDDSEKKIKEWAEGKRIVTSKFFQFDTTNKPISCITYSRTQAEAGGNPEKETALFLKNKTYPLVYIKTDINMGYGAGNNVGIRYLLKKGDGPFIWILNNDTVVDKNALLKLISCVKEDKSIGMIGSKLLYYEEPNILQAAGGGKISPWLGNTKLTACNQDDNGTWDRSFELDYICGASLLIKKTVLEDIGLMDEQYFLYWEDADWGTEAKKKHYRLIYCPESKVWHKEGSTSGGVTKLTDYYWVRNGLLFTRKFYPLLLPIIPFSYFIKYTIVRMLKKQPLNFYSFLSGTRDFLQGKKGKQINLKRIRNKNN